MPPQGKKWLDHADILTYEELLRLITVFSGEGVHKIRLTGGEPLVRKGLTELRAKLKLAIDDTYHACAVCGKPTDKTVEQQHAGRSDNRTNRDSWALSERRMKNRGVTGASPCCWWCYQDKLTMERKA
jgi:organic radical activating enzyme